MKKISSDDATSSAKVFVFIPLAILLVIFILTIFDYIKSGGPVSVPVGVLGIFLFLIWSSKVSVWSLADEVFDDGNKLIIKKGNEEQTVLFSEIEFLNDRTFSKLQRITIQLLDGGKFGSSIDFVPINSGSPFKIRSEFITELSSRINIEKAKL